MEVAGLGVGLVSLATLFDSCIDAFQYIETGKHFGKNYQDAALKLEILKLRLSRWRKTVEFDTDEVGGSKYAIPIDTEEEENTVRRVLGSIGDKFEDARKLSEKYTSKGSTASLEVSGGDVSIEALSAMVAGLAFEGQKNASVVQKTKWALRGKRDCDELISSLIFLVDQLEDLFSGHQNGQQQQNEALTKLAKDDAKRLVASAFGEEQDEAQTALLEEASEKVDKKLKAGLDEVANDRGRHEYDEAEVKDRARLHQGDYVAKDFQGQPISGAGHTFSRLVASDDSRVQQGDNLGGPSVFDD